MIQIEGNREALYQWDLNQRIVLTNIKPGIEVHFSDSHNTEECCPIVETYEENGRVYADIPNIFLQKNGTITVYIYVKENDKAYTEHHAELLVLSRKKPADYVYTETEVKRWEDLESKIERLNELSMRLGIGIGSVVGNDIENNISGVLGYYWGNIDFENNKITLVKEQGVMPTEAFEIGYEIGDVVSIVNNVKYTDSMIITDIDKNVITVDILPFTEINVPPNLAMDDYSLFVAAKPLAGEVPLGWYSSTFGENNWALERSSFTTGKGNRAKGQYCFQHGRDGEAHYLCRSGGRSCKAIGHTSEATGNYTETHAPVSFSRGHYTYVGPKASFSTVDGAYTKAMSHCQRVFGKYNIPDEKNEYVDIVGNGTSENNRSNAYTLDWKGNATYAGWGDFSSVKIRDAKNPANKFEISTDTINLVCEMLGDYKIESVVEGITEKFVFTSMCFADKYTIFIGDMPLTEKPIPVSQSIVTAAKGFENDNLTICFYSEDETELRKAKMLTYVLNGKKIGKFMII